MRNETFDTKTRTFTFVLASETPVRTWRIDEAWNYVEVDEVLPMKGLRGLDGFRGCPLLDTHSSWSVRDVLGRITALRVEGSELVGDAFLSDREDVAGVARDLETGVLGEFSVGFDILDHGTIKMRKGDVPLVTIAEWSVREGSLVPLPADSTAIMRSGARARSSLRLSPGARASTPKPRILKFS